MLLKTIYISKITKNKIIKDQLPPNRATLYNILTPRVLPLLVDVAGFQSYSLFQQYCPRQSLLVLKAAVAVILKYHQALVPYTNCVLTHHYSCSKLPAYEATTTVLILQNSLSP